MLDLMECNKVVILLNTASAVKVSMLVPLPTLPNLTDCLASYHFETRGRRGVYKLPGLAISRPCTKDS